MNDKPVTIESLQARVNELEKALRFYATESHTASDDGKHNRLYFEDCDHPDCIKARNMLAKEAQP